MNEAMKCVVVRGAVVAMLAGLMGCTLTGSGTTPIGDPCESTPECVPGSICFNQFCVGEGAMRVSLSFTAASDFDLHLVTPSGEEIYWANRDAQGGILDVDQCVSSCTSGESHVENIVFSASAPAGTYEVWVENFDGEQAGDFTIDVVGEANHHFTGSLPATGDAASEHFTFTK